MATLEFDDGNQQVLGAGADEMFEGDLGGSALAVRQSGQHWLLLGEDLRVNGWPVVAGLAILRHGDEVSRGRDRLTFSTIGSEEVFTWEEADPGKLCQRCMLPLEAGRPVVACPMPECGMVHHEEPDKPCWSRGGCAQCRRAPSGHASSMRGPVSDPQQTNEEVTPR